MLHWKNEEKKESFEKIILRKSRYACLRKSALIAQSIAMLQFVTYYSHVTH